VTPVAGRVTLTSVGLSRILLGALVLAGLLACTACDAGARSLRWRLEFEDPAVRADADQVVARVLRGGCDATRSVYEETLREGASAMTAPDLEPGRYGFAARARDDTTCRFVAEGCEEVDLPLEDGAEIVTLLQTLAGGAIDPECSTMDGGLGDGGPEGGVDAGPPPDGGACEPDAGAPASCPVDEAPDSAWTYDVTVYVDPSGDDGNDGSTPALAVATLGRAIDLYEASGVGGRIVLASGRYVGLTEEYSIGSADEPLRIEGPSDAILDGGGGASTLILQQASHVVLEGFTIENADRPVRFEQDATGSEQVVLRGLTVRDGGACLRLYSVDDYWIEGNVTRNCTVGIHLLGSHRGVVRDNDIADSADGWGITTAGGTRDVIVTGNTFRDLGREAMVGGGESDFSFARPIDATEEARRVYFLSNLVLRAGGATDAGGGVHGAVAFESCADCVMANNTILLPSGAVVRILPGNPGATLPTRNDVFVNNLIVFFPTGVSGYVEVGSGEVSPETFTFGGNLFHPLDGGSFDFAPPAGASTIAPSITVPMGEEVLVDFAGGDYRPIPCGPADGAGASLEYDDYDPIGARAPVGDMDARCFLDPPAIGAWEAD